MIKLVILITLFVLSCVKSVIEYGENWGFAFELECFIDIIKLIIPKCIIWGILYLIIF